LIAKRRAEIEELVRLDIQLAAQSTAIGLQSETDLHNIPCLKHAARRLNAAWRTNLKQIGLFWRGELDQVRAAGNLADLEGRLGFGIEADAAERRYFICRYTKLVRCRRSENAFVCDALERG